MHDEQLALAVAMNTQERGCSRSSRASPEVSGPEKPASILLLVPGKVTHSDKLVETVGSHGYCEGRSAPIPDGDRRQQ
jgi:hypothetical protein